MSGLAGVLGISLIGLILWEVFNDLFHPGGTGALSNWIGRALFNWCRRIRRFLPIAGPLALVTTIFAWIAGLVVGFALLYFHSYPHDFRTSTASLPPDYSRLPAVLYFSFETLITLGYGDLVPFSMLTRFVASFEALVGFALLTASVSSIVLLYPALARMRLLARGVSHIVTAEATSGITLCEAGSDVALDALAREVTQARIDLIHFPILYYFTTHDDSASVARWTQELVRIAASGAHSDRPRVQLAANTLDAALHDFATILNDRYLHTESRERGVVFDAFARHHLIESRTGHG